ncbi:unnamed protein product, partial [Phaeothamnion confervicola]
SFSATNGAIVLTGSGNTFGGNLALTDVGANNVTVNYNGSLALGAVNVTGPLSVSANGNITQATGTGIVVTGNAAFAATNGSITLTSATNAFNGSVGLTNTGANTTVALTNNKSLALGAVNVTGALTVTDTGNITQAGNAVIAASGNASFTATNGSIALTDANQFSGNVSLTNTGANTTVGLTNNRALALGSVNVTGPLSVNVSGNVTQATNAAVVTSGNASFAATNGAITLANGGNVFGGNLGLANTGASNNVTVSYNGALSLGSVNVAGPLSVTATGNISQATNTSVSASGNASLTS